MNSPINRSKDLHTNRHKKRNRRRKTNRHAGRHSKLKINQIFNPIRSSFESTSQFQSTKHPRSKREKHGTTGIKSIFNSLKTRSKIARN